MRMGWRKPLCAAVAAVAISGLGASAFGQNKPAEEKDWTDQIRQPVPWFKWGADLRLRHEYLNNQFTLNQDGNEHEWNFERVRPRVWGTLAPLPQENVSLTARLIWEFRHWWEPDSRPEWDWSNGVIDNLYVKWAKPLNTPLTVTVGRQEITDLGRGWLILDGTPLDGSRTVFFDAVRVALDLKQIDTTIQGIYLNDRAQPVAALTPWGNRDANLIEQNEQGAVLWVTYHPQPEAQVEGFAIYKRDRAVQPNGDNADMYAFGPRFFFDATKSAGLTGGQQLVVTAQGAYECGTKDGNNLSAWGATGTGSYGLGDQWGTKLSLTYEFLSGDKSDTGTNEQFDPFWGRWPQWSELLVYTWATETRIAQVNNLHRGTLGVETHPFGGNATTVIADYSLLWADQDLDGRAGFGDGNFRGQLFRAILKHTFNKHFAGHLWAEHFIPDDFFSEDRQDAATYLRAELMITL